MGELYSWMDRIYVVNKRFKINFSFSPDHENVIDISPRDKWFQNLRYCVVSFFLFALTSSNVFKESNLLTLEGNMCFLMLFDSLVLFSRSRSD